MTNEFRLVLIWLFAGTAGVFMAMNAVGGSFTGVEYLPVGNDSFYHARRILDAVADPAAFFEFDQRIHVPEGSWVPWPWLYDFMMAKIVVAVMLITGTSDPGPVLAHIPVFWVYVNVLLMMLIARQLGFGYAATLLACMGMALSPLTQGLHATGMIDHHFVELTFVLLVTLSGLRWFAQPETVANSVLVGFVLGIAPGFHNGLFILQIPVLAACYLAWVRGIVWQRKSMTALAAALMAGTLIVLSGSEPFWRGMFVYYHLSVFHLYAAGCTGALLVLIADRRFSPGWLAVSAAVATAMLLPVLGDAVSMGAFLNKDIARFDVIAETESAISAIRRRPEAYLLEHYTILILLTPILAIGFIAAALRSRPPRYVFFPVMGLFCLALFISQLRFQYFGLCFLVLGPLLLAKSWARRIGSWPTWLTIALFVFYGVSYARPVDNRLRLNWPLGLDDQYRLVYPALPVLKEACAAEPGLVLAYNDLGHYIRYHTECSVIANNFLLTDQHQDKIREMDDLFAIEIEPLLESRPDIRFILVSFPKFLINEPDGRRVLMSPEAVAQVNSRWPLLVALLLWDDYGSDRLELLFERRASGDDAEYAVVKLFRVRAQAASGAD